MTIGREQNSVDAPPPAQRLAWVSRMEVSTEGSSDEGPVWELFPDRSALEAEMTTLANERLRAQGMLEDDSGEPPPLFPADAD